LDAAGIWPTPMNGDGPNSHNQISGQWRDAMDTAMEGPNWKTPHGMSNRDFRGKVGGCGGGEFANQANKWPTPQERDFKSGESNRDYGNSRPLSETVLTNWPTPQASDEKMVKGGKRGPDSNPSLRMAESWETSHQVPAIPDGQPSSTTAPGSRRRLNPRFVEWLMGFPIGWTELCTTAQKDSADSGMRLSRKSRSGLAGKS
jgi:hypothetical protein